MDVSIGEIDTEERDLDARLALILSPGSFCVPWTQCSATAEFLARYLAVRTEPCQHVEELSYGINELIENALKYCDDQDVVRIVVGDTHGHVVCMVTNRVAGDVVALHARLDQLICGDPLETLVARVEDNAGREEAESGLGLLTLLADYGVRLGFRLHQTVDATAHLLRTTAWFSRSEVGDADLR